MKASEANLLLFLRNAPQFAIPIYQRNYSWEKIQCQQLWDDILNAGRNENLAAHFIGSIVYVQGLGGVLNPEPLLVIDGQQRLTTSILLIAALENYFTTNDVGNILNAFNGNVLRQGYLINPLEVNDRQYKLILSEADKNTLFHILRTRARPIENANLSTRICENYQFFQDCIAQHCHAGNVNELEIICRGLSKLAIVDIALDRAHDNPQLIFESMNSTGLALSQADLIRNYILMGLPPAQQTELYTNYWRPMEEGFGHAAYSSHFDAFMRHYLTVKTGDIPNIRNVYAEFKKHAQIFNGTTEQLVKDIHLYSTYFCAIALKAENDTQLKHAFHDLRELKTDVAYPFLLHAYHHYKQNIGLTTVELCTIVRLVESYVFRRAVCGLPTNSLNKIFPGLLRTVKSEAYLESVQATFQLLPSYRRFPTDEEFQTHLKERNLYSFPRRRYWLSRLENHGQREWHAIVEDFTIEHILPQNENLSPEWQNELGEDWQRIQSKWLHTLGNLTLTAYNSRYSDFSFRYKKDEVIDTEGRNIGFGASPLYLNHSLRDVEQWNEDAILRRANILSERAIIVWSSPGLDEVALDRHRPENFGQQYGFNDYPLLVNNNRPMELFNILRNAIRELDPACVREEFLRSYIAYKAETNFVDIVPQATRLQLVINMKFADIEDPKNLCRDISGVGHQGNGDVSIEFNVAADLPYVMGIIRQSFDSQMMGALQDD